MEFLVQWTNERASGLFNGCRLWPYGGTCFASGNQWCWQGGEGKVTTGGACSECLSSRSQMFHLRDLPWIDLSLDRSFRCYFIRCEASGIPRTHETINTKKKFCSVLWSLAAVIVSTWRWNVPQAFWLIAIRTRSTDESVFYSNPEQNFESFSKNSMMIERNGLCCSPVYTFSLQK